MSDEETAQAEVATETGSGFPSDAPGVEPETGTAVFPSMAEQLAGLRVEALAELAEVRKQLDSAEAAVNVKRRELQAAIATTLDMGVDLEDVAKIAALSTGTTRTWGKVARERGA